MPHFAIVSLLLYNKIVPAIAFKHMKQLIALFLILGIIVFFFISKKDTTQKTLGVEVSPYIWSVSSIDTMKYSRDVARQYANDPSFDQTIEKQISGIAKTGATHVAIGTPYNEEFVPFMKRWITEIRKQNMKVWFRGNTAGWEGWFEYPRIGRAEHTKEIIAFITNHPEIFETGDIFSTCPECENGGPGDPRRTGDKEAYRAFLINEYQESKKAFNQIGVGVATNYFSMNGDVAKLIMDKPTTQALDGLVVIDHYVKTPDKLIADIDALAVQSGGRIVLGEWGAPIPDINGKMNEQQQYKWISEALAKLYKDRNVSGLNYWTSYGSSTAIWNDDGTERKAVSAITRYYKPVSKSGVIVDELNHGVSGVSIKDERNTNTSLTDGTFILSPAPAQTMITIEKDGYIPQTMEISEVPNRIILKRTEEDIIFTLQKKLLNYSL
jgi:hypothetical protein